MLVYVVQPTGLPFVKIGFTGSPDLRHRLCGLQDGCPVQLKVLRFIPHFDRRDEAELLLRFKAHRSAGGREWFHFVPEIRAWLDALPTVPRSVEMRYQAEVVRCAREEAWARAGL